MKSLSNFIKWLSAVLTTAALLVAVPVVLIAAPSPLDPDRGVRSLVTALIDGTQIFDESVVALIVAVGWLLWAYLAASFAVEVLSVAVGAASRNVRGLSFGQSIARPLIGALMWSSTASTLAMSVVGAGGAMALTTEVAQAAEIETEAGDIQRTGQVYRLNDDDREPTPSDPIVIDEAEGTLMVDGQLVRPHLVVVKDDTMWDLAETHLLDPFRWPEIAELNLGRPQPNSPVVTDPDLIWPGTILLMPGDAVGLNTPPPAETTDPPVEEEAAQVECEEPEIQVWTPDADIAPDEPASGDANQPSNQDQTGDNEAATAGRDEAAIGTQLPWWWLAAAGGAGAIFAAGMVRVIAKRRDRDQALGLGVEEIDELEALLEDFDEPEADLRTHLLSAAISLRDSLEGVDAPLLQVDADKTTAVFTEVVHPGENSPWSLSAEDGERAVWELPHPDEPTLDRDAPGTPLYGVGDNMFLNLEAVGWLGIQGDPDLVASHLRHLVHDLVGNFGQQHEFVLRVGGPSDIMGAEVYGNVNETSIEAMRAEVSEYLRQVDEHHNGRGTTLAAQLRQGETDGHWPSLVLILDLEEVDHLAEIIEPLHRLPGRYPIAVISVGVSSGAPWTARLNSAAEMVIETNYFDQAPRVKPQLMSESTSIALAAELKGQLSTRRWEPTQPPTSEPVIRAEDNAQMDWFDNIMEEYIEPPVNGSSSVMNEADGKGECMYENPLPGHRLSYSPSDGGLAETLHPRITPDQLASISDPGVAPPRNIEELEGDEEVDKVLASHSAPRPQLRLLGRPQVSGITGEVSQRALATAALLALSPQGLDRAKIRDLIWNGRNVDMRQVRKVLSDLQNAVGSCLGRALSNNSLITLNIDTDIDEIERRMARACGLEWPEASALITETIELVAGAPLEDVAFQNWWNWVDNDGGIVRRQLLERVETALAAAGDMAEAKADWRLLRSIGDAGLSISAMSQRMAAFAALGAVMSGHTEQGLTIVTQWESDFESNFDVAAPGELRQRALDASRSAVSS